MLVRIQFGKGAKLERAGRKNRRVAAGFAALLTPAAVMAAVLGCWRLASDLKLAGDFAISSGLFSHWQVWFASAALLVACSRMLNHYGRADESTASKEA